MIRMPGQPGGSEVRLNFVGLLNLSDYELPYELTIEGVPDGERLGNAVASLIDIGLDSGLIASNGTLDDAGTRITLLLFAPTSPTIPPEVWISPPLRESLLRLLQEGRSELLVRP